jgi:hypothetical protein
MAFAEYDEPPSISGGLPPHLPTLVDRPALSVETASAAHRDEMIVVSTCHHLICEIFP